MDDYTAFFQFFQSKLHTKSWFPSQLSSLHQLSQCRLSYLRNEDITHYLQVRDLYIHLQLSPPWRFQGKLCWLQPEEFLQVGPTRMSCWSIPGLQSRWSLQWSVQVRQAPTWANLSSYHHPNSILNLGLCPSWSNFNKLMASSWGNSSGWRPYRACLSRLMGVFFGKHVYWVCGVSCMSRVRTVSLHHGHPEVTQEISSRIWVSPQIWNDPLGFQNFENFPGNTLEMDMD